MKTLEELKADFTQELLELERLAGIWPSTIEKRHVKEQAIGRLCYLAEEDLSPPELVSLKRALVSMTAGGEPSRPNSLRGVPPKIWYSSRFRR
jgi:hypothetical protein